MMLLWFEYWPSGHSAHIAFVGSLRTGGSTLMGLFNYGPILAGVPDCPAGPLPAPTPTLAERKLLTITILQIRLYVANTWKKMRLK